MYIALFMWTPTLSASAQELFGIGTPPPYGLIFSLLMACLMLGSLVFQILTSSLTDGQGNPVPPSPHFLLRMNKAICACAAVACMLTATMGMVNHWTGLGALLCFEFSVGMYYPAIGSLRGKFVPRESRGLVMHASKTLLAVLVLTMLLNFASMASIVFMFCAMLLGVCWFCLYSAGGELSAELATPQV